MDIGVRVSYGFKQALLIFNLALEITCNDQ